MAARAGPAGEDVGDDERNGRGLAGRGGDAMMKPAIVSMALGERYEPLIKRQAESVKAVGEPATHSTLINRLPPNAPTGHGLPHLAYCAKPFAMQAAWQAGHDLLLWIDAACYLVKPLGPLWEHLEGEHYYVQENGWNLGQWSSDAALATFGITRDEAMGIPEISTMAIGLDMRHRECREFLREWCRMAADGRTFLGAHTNDIGPAAAAGVAYRNVGHVSDDPRCLGTRHDQTAATYLAHKFGWKRTPRPIFASYREICGGPDARTLIINHGNL